MPVYSQVFQKVIMEEEIEVSGELDSFLKNLNRPMCFGQFSKESEFCTKVCRHADDCIKKQESTICQN